MPTISHHDDLAARTAGRLDALDDDLDERERVAMLTLFALAGREAARRSDDATEVGDADDEVVGFELPPTSVPPVPVPLPAIGFVTGGTASSAQRNDTDPVRPLGLFAGVSIKIHF